MIDTEYDRNWDIFVIFVNGIAIKLNRSTRHIVVFQVKQPLMPRQPPVHISTKGKLT